MPKQTKKFYAGLPWLELGSAIVALVGIGLGLGVYQLAYAERAYPGVEVGVVKLKGLTQVEAEAALTSAWDTFSRAGIPLTLGQQTLNLTPSLSSATDPDLSYELLRFNSQATASRALALGHSGGFFKRALEAAAALFLNGKLEPVTEVEVDRVVQFIRDSASEVEIAATDARFAIDLAGNLRFEKEAAGTMIDRVALEQSLKQRLNAFSSESVEVQIVPQAPQLTERDLAPLLKEAQALLVDRELIFQLGDEEWKASPEVWHAWLSAKEEARKVSLALKPLPTDDFWLSLEQAVNSPARNARFELADGKVSLFEGGEAGRTLDRVATLEAALAALEAGESLAVPLAITTTEPEVTTAEVNDLGITEIIGVGRSNFKGSPPNRRHNIKVGAQTLNGLIIQPNEEFSLVKALGAIDATTGYLPELVIKGNRTIPEFGGGLCQIGTTIFRAALASGLPIVERRNHSYRVVYYEPAGTDATIYDPKPDFRFLNDTGGVILIQTRIKGDDLIFEFWGTKDGRKVEQTTPRIYNIVAPPPTKLIETEDLEPGVKKCTEKPHSGADTEFTYTVTYPSGEVKQEVFKSHYIPWQEVCLVGVPKGTLPKPSEPDTPTPSGEQTNPAGA